MAQSRSRRIGLEAVLVAALAAGTVAGPAWTGMPASADEASAPVVAYGWASNPAAGAPAEADPLTGQIPATGGADTVPPGSVPAGLRGGDPAQVGFLKFDVSSIPADADIQAATLTFTEVSASPNVTAVLSCRATEAFEEGEGQAWSARPATDEFGCNGVEPQGDGTWTVNMAFTVRQWVSGTAENHGLEIQPGAPENLPTGQSDPTTINWLAAFAGPDSETPPVLTVTYAMPIAEPPPIAPPPTTTQPPPPPSSSGGGGFGFSDPVLDAGPQEPAPAPDVAEPEPQVADPAPAAPPEPVAAEATEPYTPWTVWLVVPMLAAMAYVLFRSMTAEVVVAESREGATSRLLKQRAIAQRAGSDATFVGA